MYPLARELKPKAMKSHGTMATAQSKVGEQVLEGLPTMAEESLLPTGLISECPSPKRVACQG